VPDLFYVSDERRHILADRNVRGAPDLVVEVISPSTRRRDEGLKRRLYDRSAVVEYWAIDPAPEAVQVYRRVGRHLAAVSALRRTAGGVLTSPLFPGLSVPLARVFGRPGHQPS
jgi:Uma2 family endonuclease